MIDASEITYSAVLYTEDESVVIDLTGALDNIGWEEGDGELAARISLGAVNIQYKGAYLSSLAKPGCVVMVYADWGAGMMEVVRGNIVDWNLSVGANGEYLDIVAYDDLYNLQKSQEDRYFSSGTGTKSAIMSILKDWGVPVETYAGPDVSHAKTVFKGKNISDEILELLEDAVKKGGAKCVVLSNKGKVSILPRGNNQTIYKFEENKNVTQVGDKLSTASLITRVKIVGKENDDERRPVEATVNGKTQYGIRQRIYSRNEDDSLSDAKSAAQEILDEHGDLDRAVTVESPDVPCIRKGDKVYVKARTLDGYFIVLAARHDATHRGMTLELEYLSSGGASGSDSSRPMLRRGSTGDYVKELQGLLNAQNAAGLVVDGIFGPKTLAAVRAYQRKHGLQVDGIVGPKTWGKLLE